MLVTEVFMLDANNYLDEYRAIFTDLIFDDDDFDDGPSFTWSDCTLHDEEAGSGDSSTLGHNGDGWGDGPYSHEGECSVEITEVFQAELDAALLSKDVYICF